jgi:hypothetical protein
VFDEPAAEVFGLRGALRRAEPRAEHAAVDDRAGVGGEDHVGQAGLRLDLLDGVAEAAVGVPQLGPLRDGDVGADRLGRVHPGVDHVVHREEARRAHQVSAGGRYARGQCSLHDCRVRRA